MAGTPIRIDDVKKKARIEIIPLIDVIFFLLATFVLFILSLDTIKSLPVQLPQATPVQSKPDPTMVTLQMSETGSCYWNREPMSVSELSSKLDEYKRTEANPRVLIAGDKLAKFGSTVLALDAVRNAGITQVSIETEVRPTGK